MAQATAPVLDSTRREFITLLGGAAAAWPLAASAQQPDRMRRIGVLMGFLENDSEGQAHIAAFRDGLQKLGWTEGRNTRIDTRWAAPDDADSMQRFAKELVALQPDLVLAHSTPTTAALLQQTRTIPIVFALVADPVGSGFIKSMARPGTNATGFTQFEFGLSAKWLELLREIAPQVARVGVVREVEGQVGVAQWAVIGAAASPLGVELSPINVHFRATKCRKIDRVIGYPFLRYWAVGMDTMRLAEKDTAQLRRC